MKYLEQWLSHEIIEALGWTILHSVWQGVLMVTALVCIFILFKPLSSQAKYWLSVASLFTLLLCAFATFFLVYPGTTDNSTGPGESPISLTLYSKEVKPEHDANFTFRDKIENQVAVVFQNHLELVVIIWLIGALVFTLRLLGGIFYIQGILRYSSKTVSGFWRLKLSSLSRKLQIGGEIRLMESVVIDSPIVIGFLKPIILLPVGMCTGLSIQQVEAVLAHELAHIKRNDFIVNLLQSVVETVFFFHPGVWWISSKIREEREKCCDDIAVGLTGDTLTYVKALTKVQEMSMKSPDLVMAFSRKKHLLGRVRRLILSENQESDVSLKLIVLTLGILCISIMAFTVSKEMKEGGEVKTDVLKSNLSDYRILKDMSSNGLFILKQDIYQEQDTSRKEKEKIQERKVNKKSSPSPVKGWEEDSWKKENEENNIFLFKVPEFPPIPEYDYSFEHFHVPEPYDFYTMPGSDSYFYQFDSIPGITQIPDVPEIDFYALPDFQDWEAIRPKDFITGDTLIIKDHLYDLQHDSLLIQARKEMEEIRRRTQEIRELYRNEYAEQMEQYRDKMKEHQQAIRELQHARSEEIRKYQEKIRAEHEKIGKKQNEIHRREIDKMERANEGHRLKMELFEKELEKELLSDKLIDEGEAIDFTYEADKNHILINGKKLNKKLTGKYKKILQKRFELPQSGTFRYNATNNDTGD